MDFIYGELEKFGYLFYVVNPFKTCFQTTAEVPHYAGTVSVWFTALIIMEYIFIHIRIIIGIIFLKRRDKFPPINTAMSSIICGMMKEVSQLAFKGAHLASYVYVYTHYSIYELPWDSVWTWIACFIGSDFFQYWGHRANHEVNILWSSHQIHHSSEEFNLTTALRLGIFQNWGFSFFYLPMAFFIPPSHFFVHYQFNLIYQFWIHTELVGDLGPIEWIFNTPSHHRVHHASAKYCIDKNYGAVFIIWDRIFGTFEAERKEEPNVYGLIEQVKSLNPLYLQFFYFGKTYEKVSSMTGLVDKFKAIFYGPGWFPGTPRLGNLDDLPDTAERKQIVHPSLTIGIQIYGGLHLFILSLFYRHLVIHDDDFEPLTMYIACAYILFSVISLGFLCNQSRFFSWLEMIRCLFFIEASLYIPLHDESFWPKALLDTVRFFHLLSAWMCLFDVVKSHRDLIFNNVDKVKKH